MNWVTGLNELNELEELLLFPAPSSLCSKCLQLAQYRMSVATIRPLVWPCWAKPLFEPGQNSLQFDSRAMAGWYAMTGWHGMSDRHVTPGRHAMTGWCHEGKTCHDWMPCHDLMTCHYWMTRHEWVRCDDWISCHNWVTCPEWKEKEIIWILPCAI